MKNREWAEEEGRDQGRMKEKRCSQLFPKQKPFFLGTAAVTHPLAGNSISFASLAKRSENPLQDL